MNEKELDKEAQYFINKIFEKVNNKSDIELMQMISGAFVNIENPLLKISIVGGMICSCLQEIKPEHKEKMKKIFNDCINAKKFEINMRDFNNIIEKEMEMDA